MDGKFENVVNQFSSLLQPLILAVIFITGILTIIYGINKLINKNKQKGLRYIGTGIVMSDVSLIPILLFILNSNIASFSETDNGIIIVCIVVMLLFIFAMGLIIKSCKYIGQR